ncbi:MAG: ABC transporter permease [Acetobacter sp.]
MHVLMSWRRRLRWSGWLSLCVLAFWLLCAVAAPLVAPYNPLKSFSPLLLPLQFDPWGLHVLGTDMIGRDILSRLIWGAQPVILWSSLATFCAYVIGITCGLGAGYLRGQADRLLSFIANMMLSFPILVLYLLVVVRLGPSGANIVLAVIFATSPSVFRVVRALVMKESRKDYVLISQTQGESLFRILGAELLPNVMGPIVVDGCLRLGYTAIMIGLLGFLGLGLPPPAPDWGGMINDGRAMAIAFPHLIIFPCLAISSLMLSLSVLIDNLNGDGALAEMPS